MDNLLDLRIKLDEAITYGQFPRAHELAEEGLKSAQQQELLAEVAYFRGQIELLNDNYQQAIDYFDQAVKHNPYDGAAYNDRALCMIELGVIDEALYYFNKGIEVEPDYATVYHNKGWLLNKIGHYTQAFDCFKQALALEPRRAVTYECLGNALANLTDYRQALSAYRKALSLLKPEHAAIKQQMEEEVEALKSKIQNL